MFIDSIENTDICLAYTKGLDTYMDYTSVFQQMGFLRVNVAIVFAPEWTAKAMIKAAISHNIANTVWIAVDAWSLHKKLPKETGIEKIGTVVGIAEPIVTIPGFIDFIYSFKAQSQQEDADRGKPCNQICNCTSLTAENIINADPSFSFSVYSAVHAIAHALHTVLKCGAGKCKCNVLVQPHMVSFYSQFTLQMFVVVVSL